MALTVSAARALVLRRVRDVSGTAHDDVLLDVMSDAQRLINAAYGAVLVDDTLTLVSGQTVYEYNTFASNVVRVVQCRYDGHLIHRTPWRQLKAHNPRWLHGRGRPRTWDMLGHNVLIVYPSPAEGTSTTLNVRYIKETDDLTIGGNFEVPAQYETAVMDLTCQILLLRQRLFPSIEGEAEAFDRHGNLRVV